MERIWEIGYNDRRNGAGNVPVNGKDIRYVDKGEMKDE